MLIADLSGYTPFIHQTEMEHAQAITQELMAIILTHVRAPYKLIQLEGDAVFYYAPGHLIPQAERVIENIEACYMDFRDHLLKINLFSNCQCRACSSIHSLDLKFVVHYGEYIVQKISNTPEGIAGRDVILVHRLLKNSVTENTGMRGYALITNACLERIGSLLSVTTHQEKYEHIGEVSCGIYNLKLYEERVRDTRRVYIRSEEADYVYERIFNTSPEELWSFIIDPERRLMWQNIKEVKNTPDLTGRLGVDAQFHCDHGAFSRITRMLDWRPFHYMTNITQQRFHKIPYKPPPVQCTFEFLPMEDGRTKISFRTRNIQRDWLTKTVFRLLARKMLDKENNLEYNRLERVLEEMRTAPISSYILAKDNSDV